MTEQLGDLVECAGAPRDIGRAQGLACRSALRADFETLPFWLRSALRIGRLDSHSARVARDVGRYFPHQAESQEGMARAAGVPTAWLRRTLAHTLAARRPHWTAGVAAVAAQAESGAAPRPSYLAARLTPAVLVRRSRPDGCFRSIEVTLPWFSSALGGVNEAGLAVGCIPGGWEMSPCAAPAALLVAECLGRIGGIEAALDWCMGRPGGGRATLLFGDDSGAVAGIEIAGAERRVRRSVDGVLAVSDDCGSGSEIGKALRERPPAGLDELDAALVGGSAGIPGEAARLLVLDSVDRRLGIREPAGGEVRWFPV